MEHANKKWMRTRGTPMDWKPPNTAVKIGYNAAYEPAEFSTYPDLICSCLNWVPRTLQMITTGDSILSSFHTGSVEYGTPRERMISHRPVDSPIWS